MTSIVVCENCNVVISRDNLTVEDRPMTICSHLKMREYASVDVHEDASNWCNCGVKTPQGRYHTTDCPANQGWR